MIEEELINQCIRGTESAHRKLYEQYAPYLYTVIKNYIRDTELRKDVLQETFAQIFSSLKKYDSNKGQLKSWMSRIAVHKSIDVIRKESKSFNFTELEVVRDTPENVFDFLDELTREDIEKLLHKMPSGYRNIFLLSVIDDYKHKEIAELLNINITTSRTQLMRALKWIRKNIQYQLNYSEHEPIRYIKR